VAGARELIKNPALSAIYFSHPSDGEIPGMHPEMGEIEHRTTTICHNKMNGANGLWI
jgi:hypothetical protein